MPKGKKICPQCQGDNGVRVQQCACGYAFVSKNIQPVKQIPVIVAVKEKPQVTLEEPHDYQNQIFHFGKIDTPAGEPPFQPKGYKKNWIDGPASDQVVQQWAYDIYNHGKGSYSTNVAIYWAKYFWDVHSSEFSRIRNLIISALNPQKHHGLE